VPRVAFTPQLERFLACPPATVAGATVAEALAAVFADNPRLRGYVLDEHGRLRRHVALFVDGRPLADRIRLSDPIGESSELFVLTALSGG
jgi:hypothetical protein